MQSVCQSVSQPACLSVVRSFACMLGRPSVSQHASPLACSQTIVRLLMHLYPLSNSLVPVYVEGSLTLDRPVADPGKGPGGPPYF